MVCKHGREIQHHFVYSCKLGKETEREDFENNHHHPSPLHWQPHPADPNRTVNKFCQILNMRFASQDQSLSSNAQLTQNCLTEKKVCQQFKRIPSDGKNTLQQMILFCHVGGLYDTNDKWRPYVTLRNLSSKPDTKPTWLRRW